MGFENMPQPTVQIIPVALTDQLKPIDNIRTRMYFFIPHPLDDVILRSALDDLIRNYWRKLGSRLVHNPKDKLLEYHLPSRFTDCYTLFKWSSQNSDKSIEAVAALPKATPPSRGITFHPPIESLDKVFLPPHWPLERNDETPDSPLLWVHITSFADASALTISCPHVLADQLGLANILKAWLGLANGISPPQMLGFDDDVLVTPNTKSYRELGEEKTRRIGRARTMTGFSRFQVVLGFIPELLLNAKEVRHLLFLPLPLVQSLRDRHTKTLVKHYGPGFSLSDGDIVAGILCKLNNFDRKSNRKVNFSTTVNLRGRIPQLARDSISFVHNALVYGTARFSVNRFTSLAEIAVQHRLAISEAAGVDDIEISLAISREQQLRGQGIHVCEPFERSFNVSNWTAAWKGVDFSSVVKKPQDQNEKEVTAKMLVLGLSMERRGFQRFSSFILSKTDDGYWCTFASGKKALERIQRYLTEDPILEHF